jgi:hypothetical protein
MEEIYGKEIEKFFMLASQDSYSERRHETNSKASPQEDDDNWFDDDDEMEELVKKGIIDSSFLQFLAEGTDEMDKMSVVSWGTGNTTYTEIITTQDTIGTVNSSITHESLVLPTDEIERRRDIVKARLLHRGISDDEVEQISANVAPYELVFSGITLPTWDAEKEVFLIMAIRDLNLKQQKEKNE